MTIDIVYVAWNRLDFTSATWAWLLAHTDWTKVNRLIVYDDGSEDGTLEFLREQVERLDGMNGGTVAELRVGDFRSPVAVMNHYLQTSEADLFAKIDNDIAVPGGWLEAMLSVMLAEPAIELLGMEAGMIELAGRDGKEWDGVYRFEPSSHIGGVGLMRVAAFRDRPPLPSRGRFGFTEWQNRYEPVRGWIRPDLFVPQLDRIPEEPWRSLSGTYIDNGWQRWWPAYSEKWMEPYWEWTREKVAPL